MNTKTDGFKVNAELGDILEFEVEVVNWEKRIAIGSLSTGQRCVCPLSLIHPDRIDSLHEPHGQEPGTRFDVRVLDCYEASRGGWKILVSEKHVEERLFHQHVDRNTAESDAVPTNVVPEEVLANARQKLALGHTVKGVVVGEAPGGGKRVDIGKFIAILSREELAGVRPDSLRKGVTVKVKFLRVEKDGITLTKKGVA